VVAEETANIRSTVQSQRHGWATAALIQSAQRRKTALENLLSFDPRSAIDFILSDAEREVLKTRTRNCVEEPATVRGTVAILHADYPDNSSQTLPIVTAADGSTVALYPSAPMTLDNGDEIQASGYLLDTAFMADADPTLTGSTSGDLEVISKAGTPPPTLPVTQVRTTLALMIYFSGQTEPDVFPGEDDRTVVEQRMARVNDFYTENSYGKLELLGAAPNSVPGGDAFGWFQIPMGHSCWPDAVRTAALDELARLQPTLDLSVYAQFVIVAPFSCGWGGYGYGADLALISSTQFVGAPLTPYVFSHEIGHNLGFQHANFGNCGELTISDHCNEAEYGDPYDDMGSAQDRNSPPQFSVHRKQQAGWLDGSRTQLVLTSDGTHSGDGTYLLSPVESSFPGIKGLKIPRKGARAGSTGDYLFIEYRQPIGFDAGLDGGGINDIFSGALLHTLAFEGGGPSGDRTTWLVDATTGPGNPGNNRTSVLPVGGTFIDPRTGTRVTVTRIIPGATPAENLLAVDVDVGPYVELEPPTLDVAPVSATLVDTVTIQATVTDNVALDRVEFKYLRPGTGNLTTFATLTTATAGDLFEAALDTTTLPDGDLNLYVFAYDRFGWWTNWFQRAVVNNLPPSVTLLSPSDSATVAGRVTIEAATLIEVPPTDGVEFFLDGTSLGPGSSPDCWLLTNPPSALETAVCYWVTFDSTRVTNGWHTVEVRAHDTLGLEGRATIRIRVDNRRPRSKGQYIE
jgi:hypothetical protein